MEQRVIDTLRNVFELNGFIGIETRAVEQGSSLLKKGETSKEIYLLSRLQEVGHESDTPIEERLGLHFDLTVPLSRYVVEHSGALAFPFKRWQIQKVWRGERPQEGRFREFVQADIDVIGAGDLPDHYEVELPLVMVSALEELRAYGLPKATVHANNRKLSEGFYRGLGLTDVEGVLREIDKLDKIGPAAVAGLLVEELGLTPEQAQACLDLATIQSAAQARSLPMRVHGTWNTVPIDTRAARRYSGSWHDGVTSTASMPSAAAVWRSDHPPALIACSVRASRPALTVASTRAGTGPAVSPNAIFPCADAAPRLAR